MVKKLVAAGAALMIIAGAATVFAQKDAGKAAAAAPSIDGTYILVKRELPDGTVLKPPAVAGMMSLANGYRNFNVAWKGPKGEDVSIGVISKFTFSATEYSETNIYYVQNNVLDQPGLKYDWGSETKSSPVTKTDVGYTWQMPLHGEPPVTITAGGMTAEMKGAFKDYWEKL